MNTNDIAEAKEKRAWALMTPKQRKHLLRLGTGLWKLLTSDAHYVAVKGRYERQALATFERSYLASVTRSCTRAAGVDYRVQFPGHTAEIRAVQSQYDYAMQNGFPCRVVQPPVATGQVRNGLTLDNNKGVRYAPSVIA